MIGGERSPMENFINFKDCFLKPSLRNCSQCLIILSVVQYSERELISSSQMVAMSTLTVTPTFLTAMLDQQRTRGQPPVSWATTTSVWMNMKYSLLYNHNNIESKIPPAPICSNNPINFVIFYCLHINHISKLQRW